MRRAQGDWNRVGGVKKTRCPLGGYRVRTLAGLVRLERTANDLEGRCSIQLSYSPIRRLLYPRPAGLATGRPADTGHEQSPEGAQKAHTLLRV